MGQRGPMPDPAALRALKGNPGRRALNLADGVNPAVEIPDKPPQVKSNKWASMEWDRAGAELEENGCIGKGDMASFTAYCMSWAEVCELEIEFERLKADARKGAPRGEKTAAAVDVYFFTTPTGFKRQSAIHRALVEARKACDIYARNFGLNPASRMRVQPSNNVQPDLPGINLGDEGTAAPAGMARFVQQQVH